MGTNPTTKNPQLRVPAAVGSSTDCFAQTAISQQTASPRHVNQQRKNPPVKKAAFGRKLAAPCFPEVQPKIVPCDPEFHAHFFRVKLDPDQGFLCGLSQNRLR